MRSVAALQRADNAGARVELHFSRQSAAGNVVCARRGEKGSFIRASMQTTIRDREGAVFA